MPFEMWTRGVGHREPCVRGEFTLVPNGEYDGSIFAAAAMRPVATCFSRKLRKEIVLMRELQTSKP